MYAHIECVAEELSLEREFYLNVFLGGTHPQTFIFSPNADFHLHSTLLSDVWKENTRRISGFADSNFGITFVLERLFAMQATKRYSTVMRRIENVDNLLNGARCKTYCIENYNRTSQI